MQSNEIECVFFTSIMTKMSFTGIDNWTVAQHFDLTKKLVFIHGGIKAFMKKAIRERFSCLVPTKSMYSYKIWFMK